MWLNSVFWLRVSYKTQGCSLIWRLSWGRIHLHIHSHGYWQDSVPYLLLASEVSFSCLPHGSLHEATHNRTADFIKWASEKAEEGSLRSFVTSFRSRIPLLCRILFIKSKLQVQPTLMVRGVQVNTGRWGSLGAIWQLPPTSPLPPPFSFASPLSCSNICFIIVIIITTATVIIY